jgi:hypothetical protein
MTDMRERIKERTDLAHTYACDGAYGTARTILADLTDELTTHWVRHVAAPMPGGVTLLGDYKGEPGTVVQTENGTRFMTVRLAAGMITSGNSYGGTDTTAVVRLQDGMAMFWGDATPVVMISKPVNLNPADALKPLITNPRVKIATKGERPPMPYTVTPQRADGTYEIESGGVIVRKGFRSRAGARRVATRLNDRTVDL